MPWKFSTNLYVMAYTICRILTIIILKYLRSMKLDVDSLLLSMNDNISMVTVFC